MKKLTCTLLWLIGVIMLHAKEPISTNKASQPLLFIENKGQITDQYKQERKDIDFRLDGGGMSIFVGDGQIHYQWYQYTGKPGDSNMQVNAYRMDVQLLGANPNAPLQKEEANSYYENYYTPRLKDGVTAKSYRRMVYKNIYPQIDWVIYTKGQELKYDFVVHKGGNPADIQLQYNGATGTELKNGAFTATTPIGSITEEAPYSYEADTKKPVASAYKLQDGVLSFDVRKQDADIVIDPTLSWGTYYGGYAEHNNDIAIGDSARVFMAGSTGSSINIATTGAYSTTLSSTLGDSYIVCFAESGVRIWGTYIGGGAHIEAIASDTTGHYLYIAGLTNITSGITTTGAHQTVYGGGGEDFYLARFSMSGFRDWATYYGGGLSESSMFNDLETDVYGNVYLIGCTVSTNNIATTGTYMPSGISAGIGSAGYVGFMAKFNSAGVRQWGTYFGTYSGYVNSGWNQLGGAAVDRYGNVYIATAARGDISVGTVGTHKPVSTATVNGGEGWIGKFNPSGNLIWGTYYGGGDVATDFWDIGVDYNCNVYAVGATNNDTGIATPGAFRTIKYGIGIHTANGFIVKFDSMGKRIWATYAGDSSILSGFTGVAVGSDDKIYVRGHTYLTSGTMYNELITPNAFQPVRGGYRDVVIAMFDTSGKHLWGSYYGGNYYEDWIAYEKTGIVLSDKYLYLSGGTHSTNNIAVGSYSHQSALTTINGNAYLLQLGLDTLVKIRQPFNDTVWCQGDSVKVKTKVNFPFRSTNVFTVQLSNANGSFASPTVIGTKTANGNDSVMCFVPRTMPAGNGYRIRIIASAPADTSDDNGKNIRIKPLPTSVVASSNAPICATDTLRLSGSSGNTDVTYSWAGVAGFAAGVKDTFRAAATTVHTGNYILTVNRQGCIVKDTTYVLVKPRPDTPDASSNSPVCTGASIALTGTNTTSGVTYVWNGPAGFGSTAQSPVRTAAVTAYSGIYRVYTSLNGCASLMYDSTSVTVYPVTASPVPGANTPLCLGQDLQLVAGTIPGASYVWSGPGGYNSTLQNPLRTASTSAFAGKYYVQAIVNGCISVADSVTVTVNAAPNITMYPSPKDSICVGQSVTFVSSNSNAGSSYTRSWYKNNNIIGGAANANYSTTTAADGDEYFVALTAYGVCATPFTDTSNIIKMHVLPYLTPSVSITANPNATVTSGTMINFTATPTNGGNKPGYQWTRNGTNITGAISNIWGASTLSNNDQICVDMTSSYLCPNPKTAKSNCIKVSIESTGIVGVWTGAAPSIYPNPATEKLMIEGIEKGTKIQLYDVVGRVVVKAIATSATTELNMANLVPGNYLLTLSTATGDRMSVKVVKE